MLTTARTRPRSQEVDEEVLRSLIAVQGLAGGDLGHQAGHLLLSVPAHGNRNHP